MRARSGLLVLTLVVWSIRPAGATTANDICSASANPCIATIDRTIAPGSILDFGSRAFVVEHGTTLKVSGGSMSILAGSIRIEPGGALEGDGANGVGETINLTASGDITIEGSGNSKGRITLNAQYAGGEMNFRAGGNVVMNGALTTKATTSDGDGGRIFIPPDGSIGGSITVNGSISAQSGYWGLGGQIVMIAVGPVTVSDGIDASGGDGGGGTIDLEGGGNVFVDGTLDVRGGGQAGDGGDLTLISGANIQVGGAVYAVSAGSPTEGAGAGGDVEITAAGNLTLLDTMVIDGAGPDGEGGNVTLTAGGDLLQTKTISLDGRGGDSNGGDMRISAGGSASLSTIDMSGAEGGGGSLDVNVIGSAVLNGNINADGGGNAPGEILIIAGSLTVDSYVHSNGLSGSFGGTITLQACDLTVLNGAQVKTTGPSGRNTLRAAGNMVIAGTLTAGPGVAPGGLLPMNTLEYRDPLNPPNTAGSSISPPPVLVPNTNLPPCSAVCGNGTLDPGEGCDDNNFQSCDGCSNTCRPEVCGDGRVECAEECDDGPANGTSGSACDTTCHIAGGLRIMPGSRTGTRGCFFEWAVVNPKSTVSSGGIPSHYQHCVDGDPTCDFDGQIDGSCTFHLSGCLGVTDSRLPECQPTGISSVELYTPDAANPSDATDALNSSTIVGGLKTTGVRVESGGSVYQTGVPTTTRDVCTPRMPIRVPHPPGSHGTRTVKADANDSGGLNSRASFFYLICDPNPATCGNGVMELGETCEDGNTQSCDGCAANCHVEGCGNGIADCGEQCDDGALNGTPGDTCTALCGSAPPALRIAGGGRKSLDCAVQWSLETATPTLGRDGSPKRRQSCTDGDPSCDFDPTPGRCGIHFWACIGGADPQLECPGREVSGIELRRPTDHERRPGGVLLREALDEALSEYTFPVGPGEVCSRRMLVTLPTGRSRYSVKARATTADGLDSDSVSLQCRSAGS